MIRLITLLGILCAPALAQAAALDGASLSLLWGVPFSGILLSIALFPILAPAVWHHHFGKITAGWTLLFLLPFTVAFGAGTSAALVVHALLAEFIPFVILLFALYTVSGGVLVSGTLRGSPVLNTGLLALGTALASIMGTTGAAMLLIRPLIRANIQRKHNVHVVVFFIFLVANIGGGLTPLGDPPLFLGFLKGVDFGWTVEHMALPVAFLAVSLLVIFFLLDSHLFKKEGVVLRDDTPDEPVRISGLLLNLPLLAAVIGAVLMSGMWKPGVVFDVLGTPVALQNIVRDVLLVLIALVSLKITPKPIREGNLFNWEPMLEVGKLFAGIFITIGPVLAVLQAGEQGALASLVQLVSTAEGKPDDVMYFWFTGLLSAFLDNAPTYLVFFNLASGDAQVLMGQMASTLLAISMGAVFMGACTYIGNAPNFMVKAIAQQSGVAMPSFFGYMGLVGGYPGAAVCGDEYFRALSGVTDKRLPIAGSLFCSYPLSFSFYIYSDSVMHIHILGICGTFMGGIAAIAKAAGHRVTGCDANVYPPMSTQLEAMGIELISGFGAEQLELQPDVFVIGNVVTRGKPLMEAILDRGLPYISGPQWLAENVLQGKWVLAVAGTHGKTTTSSMLAWILEDAGLAPGFLIGGIPENFGISARLPGAPTQGSGQPKPVFVIEADEYDTAFFDKRSKFVHYRPRTAVLNNLEFDHADIFADLAAIKPNSTI